MRWFTRMVDRSKKNHGFTLVELMIVVVIVGILAAVAMVMYRGFVRKAMATEATANLGTVRTALRVVYAQHGDHTKGETIVAGPVGAQVPGIDSGDLQGTYFDHDDYAIMSITSGTFTLKVNGDIDSGRGNNKGKTDGIGITMDHEGTIVGP